MRKLAVGLLVTVVAIVIGVACFPQGQCDGVFIEYCAQPNDPNCQGHIIDSTHWESGPIAGAWLPFGPEGVYFMHLRDGVTGDLLSGQAYNYEGFVGAIQTPNSPGNNFSPCSGNLCEFTGNVLEDGGVDPTTFFVKNDTCSSEYFRFLVTMEPGATIISSSSPSTDAGTE